MQTNWRGIVVPAAFSVYAPLVSQVFVECTSRSGPRADTLAEVLRECPVVREDHPGGLRMLFGKTQRIDSAMTPLQRWE